MVRVGHKSSEKVPDPILVSDESPKNLKLHRKSSILLGTVTSKLGSLIRRCLRFLDL